MAGVSDWSDVADENTSIDGINIAEHCPAKNINNAIRSVMAALKNKCDALDSTDNTLRLGAVIGEVRWFAMSTPPEGWLVCNGATVYTSNYPALFAAIGDTFTPRLLSSDPDVANPEYGDPTVFRLPNLIGKTPWGSTSVGTVIDAGLPNITGTIAPVQLIGWAQDLAVREGTGALAGVSRQKNRNKCSESGTDDNNSKGWETQIKIDASLSNSIYGNSATVQPPALCLLPCIRYE